MHLLIWVTGLTTGRNANLCHITFSSMKDISIGCHTKRLTFLLRKETTSSSYALNRKFLSFVTLLQIFNEEDLCLWLIIFNKAFQMPFYGSTFLSPSSIGGTRLYSGHLLGAKCTNLFYMWPSFPFMAENLLVIWNAYWSLWEPHFSFISDEWWEIHILFLFFDLPWRKFSRRLREWFSLFFVALFLIQKKREMVL